nr:MAG TPA: hypothetical protein [Caudoviricetes sp.]
MCSSFLYLMYPIILLFTITVKSYFKELLSKITFYDIFKTSRRCYVC